MHSDRAEKSLEKIVQELPPLTRALEKQNNWGRRFLLGIVIGIGSAIGAGIIATLLIFLFRQLLRYWFHVDLPDVEIAPIR